MVGGWLAWLASIAAHNFPADRNRGSEAQTNEHLPQLWPNIIKTAYWERIMVVLL